MLNIYEEQALLQPQDLVGDRHPGSAAGEDAAAEEGALEGVVAVDAAAAEAGGLTGGVEAGEHRAVGAHDAAAEVGLDAAEGLARQQVHAHGDEGAVGRVEQAVRRRDAAAAVRPVVAAVADQHDLRVLAERVVDLAVAGGDDLGHPGEVQHGRGGAAAAAAGHGRRPGELVHAGDEVGEVVADDEVGAVLLEVLDGDGALGGEDARQEELPEALGREVRVLLGPGERELARDDGLVQHEPGVVVARAADVPQRRQRVASRVQERRQPDPRGVEPERGRRRQHPDPVARPDRVPVLQALGVVPHCRTHVPVEISVRRFRAGLASKGFWDNLLWGSGNGMNSLRSRLMTFAPADSTMSIMRPSTWAGTPMTKFSGTLGPRRSTGQAFLTASTFPPMPPVAMTTAEPRSSNVSIAFLDDWAPRSTGSCSSTRPRTPTALPDPSSTTSSSTTWRKRNSTRPFFSAARTGSAKTRTTSGPAPQVMWKRGTELPWPSAVPSPRSAQPTLATKPAPRALR
ncbi:putative fumarate reductase succinate dehydrogenase flavo protein [Rosellinia necatrix]|uniref:Putative fumarate reductase succinate dehydrogenase flavo protein n=1 Tax=Rosellinia necatrix TaxID=77044 RepID=A0A1S8A7A0_ROSNE|nr:putative fumarate reductase succinate dehydrogenase flavo protein [Rosellinia necatrix]